MDTGQAVQVVSAGEAAAGVAQSPVAPQAAPADAEGLAPAAPFSPLSMLRGKRSERDSRLHLDLAVPRWDEVLGARLWVRYGPASPAKLAAAMQRREKTKDKDSDWALKANADLLCGCCEAVYGLPLGIEPTVELELDERLTFGSPELGEVLGVTSQMAVEVCRAVYATDGDLFVAAEQLMGWSAAMAEKGQDDFLAN